MVSPRREGTPQGGPLSPLLSNVLLDELDKELERRGHRFCRYADDCNVYVQSRRAGERVMESLEKFLWERLRLKVNRDKSAVARPWRRKFLGYSVTVHRTPRLKVAPGSVKRPKLVFPGKKTHRKGAEDAKIRRGKKQGWKSLCERTPGTDLLFSTLGPSVVFLCASEVIFSFHRVARGSYPPPAPTPPCVRFRTRRFTKNTQASDAHRGSSRDHEHASSG